MIPLANMWRETLDSARIVASRLPNKKKRLLRPMRKIRKKTIQKLCLLKSYLCYYQIHWLYRKYKCDNKIDGFNISTIKMLWPKYSWLTLKLNSLMLTDETIYVRTFCSIHLAGSLMIKMWLSFFILYSFQHLALGNIVQTKFKLYASNVKVGVTSNIGQV